MSPCWKFIFQFNFKTIPQQGSEDFESTKELAKDDNLVAGSQDRWVAGSLTQRDPDWQPAVLFPVPVSEFGGVLPPPLCPVSCVLRSAFCPATVNVSIKRCLWLLFGLTYISLIQILVPVVLDFCPDLPPPLTLWFLYCSLERICLFFSSGT